MIGRASEAAAPGALLALAILALAVPGARRPTLVAQGGGPLVFAAASLKNALDDVNRQYRGRYRPEGDDLLCREFDPGEADRERRAGRYVHLGRPALDGLRAAARSDRPENPPRPARQQPRADRAEGQRARCRAGDDRAGLSARQTARRRQAGDGRAEFGAGRHLRQGGADQARRLGSGRRRGRRGRERARRAGAGGARRGAARHRLQDRCGDRAGRQNRRHLPERTRTSRSSTRWR